MNKSLNYEIVCFAPSDWWSMNPSCTTHYMSRFAKETKVLYINPFSSDIAGVKKGLLRRIPRKINSLLKFLKRPQDNLYVFSPIFLPLHGVKLFDRFNNFFLKIQIRSVLRILGIKKPLVWLENPRAVDLLDQMDYHKVIYHVSDHFSKSRYVKNKQSLEQRESRATQKSDLIVTVSKSLYDMKKNNLNVKYLPHGVDYELFHDAAENNLVLEELTHLKKPIVGYYGTLSGSNDVELWTYCARQLSAYSFVFAGKVTGGEYEDLMSLPNVHFLGKLPYEKIPSLCAGFDVCMLQWRLTDWIRACNPLKTMEYMASGKPIVSVPIQYVIDNFNDIVSIAQTKEEFCEAIEWELTHDTAERSAKRMEIAESHSWESHYCQIKKWIGDIWEGK